MYARMGIFVLLLVVLATGCLGRAPSEEPASATTGDGTKTSASMLEPQINELASVTVEVSPKEFVPGSPISFDISMNTHSVDLNYDLTKTATLIDDAGNIYRPLGWDGSPPSGHHRSGALTFPPLPSSAQSIKLVLSDINGADRVFEWQLK